MLCALLAGVGSLLAADPSPVSTNTTVNTNISTTVNASTAAHKPDSQTTGKTTSPPVLSKPSGNASGKKVEVTGPLVKPLKEKGFKNGARKALNLFNPFAPVEKKERVARTPDSQAWSTTVGWYPGASAWSDDRFTRPQSGFIMVTCPDVPK